MQEEISQVTSTNSHQGAKQPPCTVTTWSSSPWRMPCSAHVSHPDPALYTSPVQLTKGANKIHPVWPVLHPAHTVSTTVSPAQAFHSLEQRKGQSACPNTKIPAPKQIRSSTSRRQGDLGKGESLCCFLLPSNPYNLPKHIAQMTQLEDEDEQEQWHLQRQTNSSQRVRRQNPTRSWCLVCLFAVQGFLKPEDACKLAPSVPAPQLSSARAVGRWLDPCTAFLQQSPSAAPCLLMRPLWVSSSWQG